MREVESTSSGRWSKKRIVLYVVKVLLVAGFVTILLMGIALSEGIGHAGSVNLISTAVIVPDHPCAGVLCDVHLNMSFNPYLYLVSYATGKGQISKDFSMIYYPPPSNVHIPTSEEIEGIVTANAAWSETLTNLPYLFVASLPTGFVLVKITQTFNNALIKHRKATKTEARIEDGWAK